MKNTLHAARKAERGFTLVEAIAAILVLSVMAIGLTRFITFSAEGYLDTSQRNQLSAAGRVVIERMTMELHNALPNSVRTTSVFMAGDPEVTAGLNAGDQCLEFFPVIAASTYINAAFHPSASTNTVSVVAFNPAQTTGDYAVIYPRSIADLYKDTLANPGHVAGVASIVASPSITDVDVVNLTPTHTFRRRSPEDRFYLVEDPVSFCVNGDRLYRYQGYAISTDQPLPTDSGGSCPPALDPCLPASVSGGRTLIATDLDNDGHTAFDHLAATLRRNAIVQFEFNFTRDGESVTMNHEVMLHSAP